MWGTNCVYYGLKDSILDKNKGLFLSGRSQLFILPTKPYICNEEDINDYGKKG